MDKENNIVYVQTKNGIFKCYKSEQMHKPIYYPIESKTNVYIDYNDVIRILNIDDLYNELKKQKEVINKIFSRITLWKMEDITMETSKVLDDLLDILKEVSK